MPQTIGVDAPFKERRDDSLSYGVFRINVDSLTAAVRHEASDELTASSSFRQVIAVRGDSQFRLRRNAQRWARLVRRSSLNWSPDGSVKLVAGAARSHVALKQFINLRRYRDRLAGSATGRTVPAFSSTPRFDLAEDDVDCRLALSARPPDETGALTATSFVVPVDFDGSFDAWLPKVSLAYDVTSDLTIGAMVAKSVQSGRHDDTDRHLATG